MRLGSVKYLIPFAFVFNPALLAQDSSLLEIAYTFVFAIIGIFFLGCAFEGWFIGVERRLHAITRVLLAAAGLAALAPELVSSLIGLAVGVALMVVTRFVNAGTAPEQEVPIDDAEVVAALTAEDDLSEAGDKLSDAADEPKPQPI
jgi:TRAP-type uncharacterized transport system fused permease subunit